MTRHPDKRPRSVPAPIIADGENISTNHCNTVLYRIAAVLNPKCQISLVFRGLADRTTPIEEEIIAFHHRRRPTRLTGLMAVPGVIPPPPAAIP